MVEIEEFKNLKLEEIPREQDEDEHTKNPYIHLVNEFDNLKSICNNNQFRLEKN
jgi:hypothetical protein